jgi:glycosyltransferase involved in cell wall biosynthesis
MEAAERREKQLMKKVLVCKSILLPYSETFIREQVLACRSWDPLLVGLKRLANGLSLDSLKVLLLDSHEPVLLHRLYRKTLAELQLPPAGFVARLKEERASLAHVHFGTEAVVLWPIIRRLGIPMAVTLHGYDINVYRESWEKGVLRFGDRRYPKRLLAIAKSERVHFIAVSEAVKRRAVEYGLPAGKVTVRHIGIDLTRFVYRGNPVSKRRRRILYVGRFVEKKGGEFLIRAYARVRAKVEGAELVMIGDGPLTKRFHDLAHELHVPVSFTGPLTSAEVKNHIDEARVFCLPSVTAENGDAEGLPIVILEAQACGVPVVTSARGGAEEGIVNGQTGFSFAERDVGVLSDRLTQLLLDDELALSMSAAAPKFVRLNFDIDKCTKSLELLYDNLTESARQQWA